MLQLLPSRPWRPGSETGRISSLDHTRLQARKLRRGSAGAALALVARFRRAFARRDKTIHQGSDRAAQQRC